MLKMLVLLLSVQLMNMNTIIKQPSVKLIPSDPMTNTILIIYCVSSTGASVPYKALWRKISPKRGKLQQIKSQNGSSYRCSPLDLDCLIEVSVLFQFNGIQMQKVVQSNLVKVSRELKERRAYMKDPIPCKVSIEELPIQARVMFRDGVLFIFPINANFGEISFALHSSDFIPEADSNQHLFRIYLRNIFEEFMSFFATLLGWRPVVKSQTFLFTFGSDINRDIILLGLAETFYRTSDLSQIALPKFIPQGQAELDKSGHSKNRSQTALSPANKEKIKISERVQMKKSQTSLKDPHQQPPQQARNDLQNQEAKVDAGMRQPKGNGFFKENREGEKRGEMLNSPAAKQIPKEKPQERQYLNVFQSDEQDLLTPPAKPKEQPQRPKQALSQAKTPQQQQSQNQPSINLRGSFQQLQRSFSNNNEQTLQKVFGGVQATKKMEAQLTRLRKENEQLKKQAQTAAMLSKQNTQIKKKYHQLKQEINRLEMQRKVILTDKLRCEVNWHKQTQEKEYLKKELDSLREMLKGGFQFGPVAMMAQQRTLKSTSIHELSNTQRQNDRNRSPNSSFYNK